VLFVAGLMTYAVFKINAINEIKATATAFISHIATGDLEKPKSMAAGQVLWNLAQSDDLPKARVERIKTQVVGYSSEWAIVNCLAELTLENNQSDVDWYEIEMYRPENTWKVIRINNITPQPMDKGRANSSTDEAQNVMIQYLDACAKGEYQQASGYLAGQARRLQEQSFQTLKGAVSTSGYTGFSFEPIYSSPELIKAFVSYELDGRQVRLVATFYKTIRGWKIVAITSA